MDRVNIGEIGGGDEPLLGEGGRRSVEQRGDRARGIIAADLDRPLPAWVPTVAATAFAVYGLWATIQHPGA